MKKELFLLLFLSLLIFASEVFSQNETTSEENNTTTILEDNTTLTQDENNTKFTKILLSDCNRICPDKEGCTCPPDCEKKETIKGSDCGKKATIKSVVSLCEGCSTDDANNPCIEVGTQKIYADGTTFYCSSGKKMEIAKESGENCNNDYECLTYTCNEGLCFEGQEDTGLNTSQIILIIGAAIIFGFLVFFTLKLLNTKKTVVKEEKKVGKKEFQVQEPGQKYTYQYKPEFDVLEKKLKESLGKVKK